MAKMKTPKVPARQVFILLASIVVFIVFSCMSAQANPLCIVVAGGEVACNFVWLPVG